MGLSDNKTGGDDAAALAECLKYNTSLTRLDLSSNEIGDAGAGALGKLERRGVYDVYQ